MNRFFDMPGDLSRQLAPWELDRRGLNPKAALFELAETIRFRSDIAGGVIVVPVGYVSDLASIPAAAWGLFMAPDSPQIELGAWVHDVLYGAVGHVVLEDGARAALTREQCDEILAHEAMPDLGATLLEREAVYAALRVFGERWKPMLP